MRDKRLNRQPSGPGRSSKRARTASASPASAVEPKPRTGATRASALAQRVATKLPKRRGRMLITRRALALLSVLVVLGVSFAGSLRVWVLQSGELATAQSQIEQRQARVAELEDELARWDDPAFVRAEARTRLGWVMPGEVGYRVIGADGKVLSGSDEIEGVGAARASGLEARWWDRLSASLEQADEPAPAP